MGQGFWDSLFSPGLRAQVPEQREARRKKRRKKERQAQIEERAKDTREEMEGRGFTLEGFGPLKEGKESVEYWRRPALKELIKTGPQVFRPDKYTRHFTATQTPTATEIKNLYRKRTPRVMAGEETYDPDRPSRTITSTSLGDVYA